MKKKSLAMSAIILLGLGSASCSDLLTKLYSRFTLGVSSENPLGTLEKTEKFITGFGLKSVGTEEGKNIIGTGTVYAYKYGGASEADFSTVYLIADSNGRVLAIHGSYLSRSNIQIAEKIMRSLWKTLGGGVPELEVIKGATPYSKAVWGTEFSKEGVSGNWRSYDRMNEWVRFALDEYADEAFSQN